MKNIIYEIMYGSRHKSIERNLERIMSIKDYVENRELIRMILRMVFNDGRIYQVKEEFKKIEEKLCQEK